MTPERFRDSRPPYLCAWHLPETFENKTNADSCYSLNDSA